MSFKSVLYIFVFIAITLTLINCITANVSDDKVNDVSDTYMIHGVKVYQGDRECALLGGLCVHKNDCIEPTSKMGLCPSNSHRGVECCYETPVRPAPCTQHLGTCRDRCPKNLVRPGTDCENGQLCCVLIS